MPLQSRRNRVILRGFLLRTDAICVILLMPATLLAQQRRAK